MNHPAIQTDTKDCMLLNAGSATPHAGSKVADVTLDSDLINKIYKDWLPADFQGVLDLRIDASDDFNKKVKEFSYEEKIEFYTDF